ncbi:type I restriction-modification system subunit M N-terminal domain-containing protein [Enterococcus faecium]|uniref:N6 adenine-specific DNA methyltransferase N-terminal domain-containing protein n=1 Tax=Enterococcus faecium TaxID=1352 RepID=A0A242BGI0_ENTFC|nr:hypothetical protein [Enterococcus faecium]OTN94604.1 hypothetical protein A5810_000847 [Enterococcus faecium]
MKTIWQYGRTGGKELEVSDDFPVQFPFTDIPPLEGIALEDQFFITSENRWKEIINALDHEKLDNLEKFYEALKNENEKLVSKAETMSQLNATLMLNDVALKQENSDLKKKADMLAQINSSTMLATVQNSKDIAAINAKLSPEGGAE